MVILSAIFYFLAMGTNFLEERGALLGHLVSRFSTHPENLATEALAFIVNRSATMREELRNLFGRTGIELPPLARFQSQAGDEQGNIPDLIGLDTTGTERLFIENKFWAGLTENQPAGYLERLPAKGSGLLVFIVPSRRFTIVDRACAFGNEPGGARAEPRAARRRSFVRTSDPLNGPSGDDLECRT
jgi:hypothetical protein